MLHIEVNDACRMNFLGGFYVVTKTVPNVYCEGNDKEEFAGKSLRVPVGRP